MPHDRQQLIGSVSTQYVDWGECEAVDGDGSRHKVNRLKPSVIILDMRMPRQQFGSCKSDKDTTPKNKDFSSNDAATRLLLALQAGARSLVSKFEMGGQLIPAIKALLEH